ncbi:MAG TPA: aspartate carbamoyltransferase [Dehalococcoidia bacterium]|jgi:aspartate carbamoyltransferase catalytic subunit|nr:aspartate carbamoyltransferase [Dehalococcoidia bacterium]
MRLVNRSMVTIDDLSNEEIEAVFSLADEMSDSMNGQSNVCQGKIMASLFFEPSTRTRLSFETAMHRLGGNVISAIDVNATSLAKGESIADMARVVGSYADIIVIRHPWEGAAKVTADYAGVPVINAGDGSHEHPTQTLCDLYTLKKERQTIKGLRIALCGDLKYGRTIHSLIYALTRLGATTFLWPGSGLDMPEHIKQKLITEYGADVEKIPADTLPSLLVGREDLAVDTSLDAIYITPSRAHQLALIPDISIPIDLVKEYDALYITRLQKERLAATTEAQDLKRDYPVVDRKLLKGKEFKRTLVMHPLPRIDELAYEVDADPRSMYFKQAARGVPIRMALIALLLGDKEVDIPDKEVPPIQKRAYPLYRRDSGISCPNLNCVSVQETETRYMKPEFEIVTNEPLTLRCVYCEHEVRPKYIASSEWHQGMLKSKKYHSAHSHLVRRIKPENLIIFNSESEAQAHGFKPSNYASKR